jgi:hypothetical protein
MASCGPGDAESFDAGHHDSIEAAIIDADRLPALSGNEPRNLIMLAEDRDGVESAMDACAPERFAAAADLVRGAGVTAFEPVA